LGGKTVLNRKFRIELKPLRSGTPPAPVLLALQIILLHLNLIRITQQAHLKQQFTQQLELQFQLLYAQLQDLHLHTVSQRWFQSGHLLMEQLAN
jgi:hypothetical protein